MKQIDLSNKIAIVTASSNGIGLQSALELAKANARVYLAARNETKTNTIINQHQDLDLHYVYFDANDTQSYCNCIKQVYELEKRIDILVNNFGGTDLKLDQTIINTNYDDYLKILDKNIKSVYLTSQTLINLCIQNKQKASIINISTIGSVIPDIARIAYCTSKAAINSLATNMATQVGKYGIRVNNVLPGLINTDSAMNGLNEEFRKEFESHLLIKRIGQPEDIANMVCFLASDLSSYMTGEIIEIAGGFGKPTPIYSKFYNK